MIMHPPIQRHYYRSDDGETFRIVQELGPDTYVVVKVFEGRTRTVKFWRGNLRLTEQHWRTRRFEPSAQGKRLLDTEFDVTLQEFAPVFNLALALK